MRGKTRALPRPRGLLALALSGMSIKDIMRTTGHAQGTVSRWLDEIGLPHRPVGPRLVTREHREALEAWAAAHQALIAADGAGSPPTSQGTTDTRLQRLRDYLLRAPRAQTVYTIADALDCGPANVRALIAQLQSEGVEIQFAEDAAVIPQRPEPTRLDGQLANLYGQRIRFGVCGDTHLGSKHQQLTALRLYYRALKQAGAQFAINHGDVTAGQRMFRGQHQEVFLLEADEQEDYAVREYPDDVPTYLIDGNHDWSHVLAGGHNVVRGMCARRADFTYQGGMEATFPLTERVTYMALHPDGGCPYARSYRLQKVIEAQMKSDPVPAVVGVGHLHYMLAMEYLGVHGFHTGCFEAQSTYLKRKALSPDVGGWLIEITLSDGGRISRVTYEWLEYPIVAKDYHLA